MSVLDILDILGYVCEARFPGMSWRQPISSRNNKLGIHLMMKRFLQNIAQVIRSARIMGREPQSFLDASYLSFLLGISPRSLKRTLSLQVLSMSPHYFYRT